MTTQEPTDDRLTLREFKAAQAEAWDIGYKTGLDHSTSLHYWSMVGAPYGGSPNDRPRTPTNPFKS